MPAELVADDWVKQEVRKAHGKFDRFSLLPREELLELSKVDSTRVVQIVLLDCLIILAAVALAERFWSVWSYVLAIMVIGARQFGIASIGLHDGAHGLLFHNRKLNDAMAACLTEPFFVGLLNLHLKTYRKQHFEHHRHANDAKDPDAGFFEAWFQAPPRKRVLLLLANGIGLTFILLVGKMLRHGSWTARVVVAGVAIVIGTGMFYSFVPAVLIFWYWVVPFATWGMLANTLRAVAEHYPVEFAPKSDPAMDDVFRTRDVMLTWFDAMFVVTRGVNFHLTHHLFPSVPFFRLKQLHRAIARREPYRQNAHVTRGYHRVLREVLFCRTNRQDTSPPRWVFF
jgi:fatty acid desaturase